METVKDFIDLLEHSFEQTKLFDECLETKLEYLGDHIFEFTTYDADMSELFATKALEVCKVITDKTTFDFIKNEENYKWFLLMCNMRFFSSKIEWGTSIRGCWWKIYKGIEFDTGGLFADGEQILKIKFNEKQWANFLEAMQQFAKDSQ